MLPVSANDVKDTVAIDPDVAVEWAAPAELIGVAEGDVVDEVTVVVDDITEALGL